MSGFTAVDYIKKKNWTVTELGLLTSDPHSGYSSSITDWYM